MNENNNIDISRAIVVGLEILDSPETKISSNLIEDVAMLKSILRALQAGQVVIVSPDKMVQPEVTPVGKDEEK
jgi:hypothetical protein